MNSYDSTQGDTRSINYFKKPSNAKLLSNSTSTLALSSRRFLEKDK